MSTCERVSLLDAARELGMNPQGLREYMKRGLIDIGIVLPNSKGTGFRYIIMREKLNRILGKERGDLFYGSEKDRQALWAAGRKRAEKGYRSGFGAEVGDL